MTRRGRRGSGPCATSARGPGRRCRGRRRGRRVLEQDLLLDEAPGDVFVDREGDAEWRSPARSSPERYSIWAPTTRQKRLRIPRKASRTPAAARPRPAAGPRRSRSPRRPPRRRPDKASSRPPSARLTPGPPPRPPVWIGRPACEPVAPPTTGIATARPAEHPPVAAVELARRSRQLAERAPRPQPFEVDRAPAGEADEERDQQPDHDHRHDRRRPRFDVEVDQVGGGRRRRRRKRRPPRPPAPASRPAAAGWSSAAHPSRRTVRARRSSSAGPVGRCCSPFRVRPSGRSS